MQANIRIDWLDCARGGTILLVVLWHSCLAAVLLGDVEQVVVGLNNALATVRMPLFFFCSGSLAARGLRKSSPELLRGRLGIMLGLCRLDLDHLRRRPRGAALPLAPRRAGGR